MNPVFESWHSLSTTNRVFLVIGLVIVVVWVWTSLRARWRDREHTVYVLPGDATFGHTADGAPEPAESPAAATPAPAAPTDAGARRGTASPPAEPPNDASEDTDDTDASDASDAGGSEAPAAPPDTPPWAPDWAEGRRLCPCCEYATDYTPAHRCSLCDWEEPPEPVLDDQHLMPPDPDDLLDAARARFRATGSAMDPAERTEILGPLTPKELELRSQLHERLEYLRSGDRPDTSETWDAIGLLFDQLHQAQERQGLDG